jgi:hypothetical protein
MRVQDVMTEDVQTISPTSAADAWELMRRGGFHHQREGILTFLRRGSLINLLSTPVKHARRTALPHARFQLFVDHGDGAAYRLRLPALRPQLAASAAGRRQQENDHGREHHQDPGTDGLQPAR